jgi:hypothetical protein
MRSFTRYVEPSQLDAVIDRYPWIEGILELRRHFRLLPMARQSWFFVLLAFARMGDDAATVEDFAEAVAMRRGREGSGPVLLHDRLRRIQQATAKPPPTTLIWLGAKAWNAWATDRSLMKLQLPTDSDRARTMSSRSFSRVRRR